MQGGDAVEKNRASTRPLVPVRDYRDDHVRHAAEAAEITPLCQSALTVASLSAAVGFSPAPSGWSGRQTQTAPDSRVKWHLHIQAGWADLFTCGWLGWLAASNWQPLRRALDDAFWAMYRLSQ